MMHAPIDDAPPRPRDSLLRLRDVVKMVGLSSTTIYRFMDEGKFPRPFELGPKAVRWRESELLAWIETLQARAGRPDAERLG